MKYIGIPTCPYCKKRVNLIRVWSMKKHGEFMCPRCKGISNIYLSPLTYIFAIIAIAVGFLIYFFQKFVFDNLSLMTSVQVLIPFVSFFILTLFMVYIEKPVIKKVRKTPDGRYFDQNGNELKMRFGKLVSASAADQIQDNSSPAANLNRNRIERQQQDFVRNAQGVRNETELEDNEQIYLNASKNRKSEIDVGFETTKIPDIDGYKIKTDDKDEMSKTTQFEIPGRKSVQERQEEGKRFKQENTQAGNNTEKKVQVQNEEVRLKRTEKNEEQLRKPAEKTIQPQMNKTTSAGSVKKNETVELNRGVKPAPIRTPAEGRKTATASERSIEEESRVDFDLPVGKIAGERNSQKVTKSGFEDIIGTYNKNTRTNKNEPPQRGRSTPTDGKKSSGFRQL